MTVTTTDAGQTYITSMPVTYDVVTWSFAGRTTRQYVTDSYLCIVDSRRRCIDWLNEMVAALQHLVYILPMVLQFFTFFTNLFLIKMAGEQLADDMPILTTHDKEDMLYLAAK